MNDSCSCDAHPLLTCDDRPNLVLSLDFRSCTDTAAESFETLLGRSYSFVLGWTNRSWAWSLFAKKGVFGEHSCDGPNALRPAASLRAERPAAPRPEPAQVPAMWSDFSKTLADNDVIKVGECHAFKAVSVDFSRYRFPDPEGPGPHIMMAPFDLPKVSVTFFWEDRDGVEVNVAVIGPLRGGGVVSEDIVSFNERPRLTDMREVARILVSMLPPLSQESRN